MLLMVVTSLIIRVERIVKMTLFAVTGVENKYMTFNSQLTYAVELLCFGSRRATQSSIPQQVRRFIQRYQHI